MDIKDYIPIKEYAELNGIDASTVRHKIRAGNIQAIKLGSCWVIDRNEPYVDLRKKENQNEKK